MKYNEKQFIEETLEYISSTYGEHYAKDGEKLQLLDWLQDLSIAKDFSRANIIKYASRFGKKGGHNKKDIFKIIHYAVLMWHFSLVDSEQK